MFALHDRPSRLCDGLTRRELLRVGGLSLLGLSLPEVLRAREDAPLGALPTDKTFGRAKSVIFLYLCGGPPQHETFDPKPDAPVEIRGDYGAIQTKVAGIRFSRHMKQLAAISDKLAVVRSIRHNQGNHGAGNHYMMTGAPPRIPVACGAFVSFHPSLGSIVARERGTDEQIPPYISMPRMSRSGGPNFLGAKYAPFIIADNPNSKNFRVRDVALPRGLTGERFLSRKQLRVQVDRMVRINEKAAGDPVLALDEFYEQGHRIITSTQAQAAFEIDREVGHIRDRYGRNGFGQRALLARRLVEAGVPFVTLYEGGWDHHRDIFKALDRKLPPFEATIAALIEDLDQRGMLDTTLVVALGEFGRTPKVNSRGGRDHWSNAMCVMFAGGGTPPGQVIGATDRQGYAAVQRVLSPENFVSTVYAKLGINPDRIYYTPQGRPTHLVSDPTPIRELMG